LYEVRVNVARDWRYLDEILDLSLFFEFPPAFNIILGGGSPRYLTCIIPRTIRIRRALRWIDVQPAPGALAAVGKRIDAPAIVASLCAKNVIAEIVELGFRQLTLDMASCQDWNA